MKAKVISSFLVMLIVVFTVLLFTKKEQKILIITVEKIYSVVKSDIHEEITFPILISIEDSPYVTIDFINNASLSDLELTVSIPFEITEIRKDNITVTYNDVLYYQYYIDGVINMESSDYTINLEEAFLNINYKDMNNLSFLIGELNITFTNQVNSDLSLSKLDGVYCDILGINTVCGVKIEIYNKSDNNVFISSIDVESTSAVIPNYYLNEINYDYNTIELLTNTEQYDNLSLVYDYNQSILIREGESGYMFFPINYIGDIKYMNQFGLEIKYSKSGIGYKYIVDDFLYMSSSPFREEVENYYTVYEIKN